MMGDHLFHYLYRTVSLSNSIFIEVSLSSVFCHFLLSFIVPFCRSLVSFCHLFSISPSVGWHRPQCWWKESPSLLPLALRWMVLVEGVGGRNRVDLRRGFEVLQSPGRNLTDAPIWPPIGHGDVGFFIVVEQPLPPRGIDVTGNGKGIAGSSCEEGLVDPSNTYQFIFSPGTKS